MIAQRSTIKEEAIDPNLLYSQGDDRACSHGPDLTQFSKKMLPVCILLFKGDLPEPSSVDKDYDSSKIKEGAIDPSVLSP